MSAARHPRLGAPMTACALVVAAAVGACFSVNLAGHPCNGKHACIDGFTCVSDICLASSAVLVDAGAPIDAGARIDAGVDAGAADAGAADAGTSDAGTADAGTSDAGFVDAGPDAGVNPDVDAGFADAGPPVVCGDGIVDGSEECDDGNVTNGDGCSSTCTSELGFRCFGAPSVCCPQNKVAAVPDGFPTISAAASAVGSDGCVFVSAGDYDPPSLNQDLTLVGDGLPSIQPGTQSGQAGALAVQHRLFLQGFAVSTTSQNASAITVSSGGNLTMVGDDVGPAGKLCVDQTGFASGLTISRSVLHDCGGGALRLRGKNVCSVTSSFIVANGGVGTGAAPIQVQNQCTLRYLTIADNLANASTAGALGVDCSSGGAGTNVVRSILWGNTSTTSVASQVGEVRSCGTSFDDFEGATVSGALGNIAVDPAFLSSADFHLAPTSPCIDAIADSDHSLDIDGQSRPLGLGDDIGADEAR